MATLSYGMIAVIVIFVIILLWGISTYNNLILLRERYNNGFSQIDVQLKRRYDLIPNLVETAKAYMKHENEKEDENLLDDDHKVDFADGKTPEICKE